MNLIRSIKISKLGVAIPEKDKEIIEFVKSMLSDLILFKYIDTTESMFYMNSEGKWILEQDNKNDMLWVRHEGFWNILEYKFSMSNENIRTLLKYMIEQVFKEKLSRPTFYQYRNMTRIEEAFKQNKK